jgi:hypothetical protein
MNKSANIKMQTSLALLVLVLGIFLLIYMIVVEDEPGALPLFLILLGTAWLVKIRLGLRRKHS